jgi:hypothetical protein
MQTKRNHPKLSSRCRRREASSLPSVSVLVFFGGIWEDQDEEKNTVDGRNDDE